MRFFGVSGVVLALGVSAVAGHSYHAFEHGHQPEVSYSGLPTLEDILHEGHIVSPYEVHSAAPEFHEDLHVNEGHSSYLEPHFDHTDHGIHADYSHHELPDFDHELHNNYVLHATHEHHGNNDDHKEEHEHHDSHDHKDKHEDHDNSHDNDHHKGEAKYEFQYGVNDPKTGDVKQQWESRTGDKVKGGYSLKEADGTTRVVHYSADKKKGFEATVHKIGHPKEKHSDHGHKGH